MKIGTLVFNSLVFISLPVLHLFLHGEIEQVTLSWNAFVCQKPCVDQLQQLLSATKGVKDLQVNSSAGTADLKWDSAFQFSYEPFRYVAGGIGLNFTAIKVRIKGTIVHDSGHLYLISDQDGSRFHLIGPIKTEPGRYTPKYNIETHPLPDDVKAQLFEIQRNGQSIVITGPLYLPAYYPLTLIISQISKPKPTRESRMH